MNRMPAQEAVATPLPDVRVERRLVGGVRLRVIQAGPDDGPLVLLLHGFPESSYGWRHQIPALAAAGFRVWAPDGRGYAGSAAPPNIDAYAVPRLVDDVVGLIDAAGRDRAHVVGHDWGGVVAWKVAEGHPGRLARLVVLNAPHPRVHQAHLRRRPRQLAKSLYMLGFQVPLLPEALLRADDHRALAAAMTRSSRPGTFAEDELEAYRRDWRRPGSLRAMLDWYRAAVRHGGRGGGPPRIRVPTLVLWGERDAFLETELATASAELCDDARVERFAEATHWLHHEEPARVNAAVIRFLAAS
jgi:epoxide hydrolase 4